MEDRERFLRTLNDLCLQSRNALESSDLKLQDVRALSEYVTNMRVLLTELEQIECGLNAAEKTIIAITDLKERYREVEGMVKEVRNDLQSKNMDF